MRTISFGGVKGGVGTTTVAALVASLLAEDHAVQLDGWSERQTRDLYVVLGRSAPPGDTLPPLHLGSSGEPTVGVLDLGVFTPERHVPVGSELTLVLRNDYLSLVHAVRLPRHDRYVLIGEPDRALGLADAHEVLGDAEIISLPVDPRIARAVDAGLGDRGMSSRMARELRQGLKLTV